MDHTKALLHTCVVYHSGQTSRGYLIMCKLRKRLERHGVDWNLNHNMTRKQLDLANLWANAYHDSL